MKAIYFSLLGSILLFGATSLNYTPAPALFEKTLFIEIDAQQDSSLFMSYSPAWRDSWLHVDQELMTYGSKLMNAENYKKSFNGRTENLYTLIHPKLIDGSLTIYSWYDPQLYGLDGYDDGELRYPIKGKTSGDNFYTSQELRDEMCYYLGQFGPQADVPMVDEYGEPIITTNADGTQEYTYPPRDYMWYRDTDIIKYKLRVRVLLNKKGEEKKRIIQSIAPITYYIDEGQIAGERILFWLDYQQLKPILKTGYFFNANGKPVSYLNYLTERVKA